MAASTDEKDFVHLIKKYLEENGTNVTTYATNLAECETNGQDRAEFIQLADHYLNEDINLITIQLWENASNLETCEKNSEELILYVKQKCPKAQIIVIGDFWSNGNLDKDKETASKAQNVTFVSLNGIKDNKDYYAGLNFTVEGKEGEPHTIEHLGVANHPGDKGM